MQQEQSDQQSSDFSAWFRVQSSGEKLTTIAERSGLTLAYLSMLRSGKRSRPSRETVAKIAQALDVDENEALLAANLMPTYGAPPQPQIQKTVNQSAETETVSADWWCQFKTGDISLRTVVKPVNLNTFLVSIKQEKETSAEQTPQAQIRWFLNQKEQATVPASKAGSTFALREGEHEFRCQWENREEVILHIRIGVGVPQHSSPSGSGL